MPFRDHKITCTPQTPLPGEWRILLPTPHPLRRFVPPTLNSHWRHCWPARQSAKYIQSSATADLIILCRCSATDFTSSKGSNSSWSKKAKVDWIWSHHHFSVQKVTHGKTAREETKKRTKERNSRPAKNILKPPPKKYCIRRRLLIGYPNMPLQLLRWLLMKLLSKCHQIRQKVW